MSVQSEIDRINCEVSGQETLIDEILAILDSKAGGSKPTKVLVGVNSEDDNKYMDWANVGESFTAIVGTPGDPSTGTEGVVRDADGNIIESTSEKYEKYTVKVTFTVPDRCVMVTFY